MEKNMKEQLKRRLLSLYNKSLLVMEFVKVNFTKEDIEYFINLLENEKNVFESIGFVFFSKDKYQKDTKVYEKLLQIAGGVKQILDVNFDDLMENGTKFDQELEEN